MSDNFYHQKIRHNHRSPYSGGGSYAGHDGSQSMAGVRSVDIDYREEQPIEKIAEKNIRIPKTRDPYARNCDFYGDLKLVN